MTVWLQPVVTGGAAASAGAGIGLLQHHDTWLAIICLCAGLVLTVPSVMRTVRMLRRRRG